MSKGVRNEGDYFGCPYETSGIDIVFVENNGKKFLASKISQRRGKSREKKKKGYRNCCYVSLELNSIDEMFPLSIGQHKSKPWLSSYGVQEIS
ncbi:unnamed protein product [Sphenostylis stenocarpa]|uniref:Uncharacterized protein n=1 Tax=Sphenostylis stenocarpa TaxID=92480 RepID=A0AA86SJ84_9FABA|nr:unnamed protein product [Sphenostylis stenocarpa]